MSKIQGLLKASPTVFKDLKLMKILYAAPNIGTTILYWFRSLSTVLNPTENSRTQGLFMAFE